MPKIKSILLLSMLLIVASASAQNTINYLNGKIVGVKQYEINGDKIIFIKEDNQKDKTKKISKLKIFSIVDSTGNEQVVYTENASVIGEMNMEEMRYFVLGEQFAWQHYKNNWNKVGGLVSGLSGGVVGFYGLPVPLLYSIINERVSSSIKYPDDVTLPKAASHEYFQYGYQKRAANKKLSEIFTFGGIGLAVGITTFVLVFDK